ncbi:hypothetical protein FDG42_06005 [Clostridium botulinum]|nr:hypothetical protein [Clostridium botulinum]NFM01769.1 hypothetical protein [Clostridium botulinum]NFM06757.1 hypothetical protein [Clostridium botulinum]NFM13134.1 hypothetical protein [Clostridium botulinum]NFM29284.1 hypothetical protein [Clostridium botulinum]
MLSIYTSYICCSCKKICFINRIRKSLGDINNIFDYNYLGLKLDLCTFMNKFHIIFIERQALYIILKNLR